MEIRELTLSEWRTALPNDGFEVFHLPEVLEVINEYAAGQLHLLGGYRGEQLVGLFPVFIRRKWIATAILSPPPAMYIPRLGPLVMPRSPKRRKQEKLNRTFTGEVLEHLNANDPFTLCGITCGQTYMDPRPFSWEGFDIETRFSYSIPLKGSSPKNVLNSFSRSLRREIRDGKELDIRVKTQGIDAVREVYEATKAHYEEQGANFPVPAGFVRDIVRTLDDRVRVYVAEDDTGKTLGGIIVLYSNDTAYFWLGGTRTEYENVSVNSLIHWQIIEDAITDDDLSSIDHYDLGNANNKRLTRYKSKYNPELVPSYMIHSGKLATLAKDMYFRIIY